MSPEIGQLTNLTQLHLFCDQLKTVPAEIGQLTNLTSLVLSSSQLTTLPAEIGQLTNLTSLVLSRSQLTTLPAEIGQLTNLTSLDLSRSQLTTLPAEIGQLTNLTWLDLNSNQLTTLPAEIGQLTNLTRLDLNSNQLTTLPAEIGQLTNLTSLNLRFNQLTTLPPEIGQLTRLTWFDLWNNKIITLPPEIGRLTNLTSLLLHNNMLTALSPEIGRLTLLTRLELSDNKLEWLPEALQRLTNLEFLDLRDNPALRLSPEVLAQTKNPALILKSYFGERRPLLEAKMLLVGQGGVGKTALVRRLLYDLPPDSEQGKTPGVDIHKWSVAPADVSEPVTLNLWDFGGQGVYQATHQFFFTNRSLYLVVINARTGEQESRLRYWLKLVASLSDNAPVIVVVNKQDEHRLALNERELKHKYPNLLRIIPTSCKTGEGIPQLRQTIADALMEMPHLNDQFLVSWFVLKDQLERMDANYITYEQYADYCRQAGIDNTADQRSWVQVLHHLGVILNYRDDRFRYLEGTHVLKPEWVTDGVYRILSDPDGQIAANNGILTTAMLDRILDPEVYPHHQQYFIVEMMRKFELSFRILHQDQYLIPDLLPKEQPPEAAAFETAAKLRFEIHYTDFLPDSVLSRFMVGMMAMLDRRASWRSGAVLQFDGNRALVSADADAQKLFIAISGIETTRRSLLNSIRMQLQAIHSTFPNLLLTEHVPIPDHPEKTIAYHALCNLEAKGISHHYDPVNDVELDVKQLLDGIETPALRRERQVQEGLLKAYNLDGLRQLCFDLNVDYEDLSGQTKSAKTRELVQLMGRNGRLDELEETLKQQRPGMAY